MELPVVRRSLRLRRPQSKRPRTSSVVEPVSPRRSDEATSDSDFAPSSPGSSLAGDEEDELFSLQHERKRPVRIRKAIDPVSSHSAPTPRSPGRCSLAPPEVLTLRTALLDWYADHFRTLPWRSSPIYQKGGLLPLTHSVPHSPSSPGAPYAVWVSEVMSQQTRLSVVEGYFTRWMAAFPDIQALADAPREKVNQLWAGLGYYRRARFLHEGAAQILSEYNGRLPEDVPTLLKIKGIGRYTAGAISSIAFGKNVPLVDGNVERVLARLCPGLTSPREDGEQRPPLPAAYWDLAEILVRDVQCPGDFNQALMEFGATLCKPKAVLCEACPVQDMCGAYQEAVELGVENPAEYVTKYPIKDPKKATKVRNETVFVLVACVRTTSGYKYLVLQRPGDGLLAGLWEAPNVVLQSKTEAGKAKTYKTLQSLLSETIGHADEARRETAYTKMGEILQVDVGKVTHVFSHIRQTLNVRLTVLQHPDGDGTLKDGKTSTGVPFRWISEEELKTGAVPTQMKKVFAAAEKKLPRAHKLR
ncbi:unnamed protein product [Chondrus crispus]|uniref:Adenine DNA glycosylase n=1 Tax=Chondrus crispus TaxID=2769 RepID=R7QEF0_CHOCR|nr:unnamed protein product [Chondrus crispus]CDF35831.1 unnamed protein product [Chondrus crispus]|eukprot:XP_005715650.1 unnamed protein product [Chondrus crispus]